MILPRLERERLIEVLIYHQRKDAQYCLCGWSELGRSHAEHIVEMFERDGVHARVNEIPPLRFIVKVGVLSNVLPMSIPPGWMELWLGLEPPPGWRWATDEEAAPWKGRMEESDENQV